MKIRNAKAEELQPKPKVRAKSPRQLAAERREVQLRDALERAESGSFVAIDLEPSDAMPTVRLAMKRVLASDPHKGLSIVSKGTTIFVSKAHLPGRSWNGRRA